MQITETIPPIKGFWTVDAYQGDIVKDKNGNITNQLVEHIEGNNIVTTTGKALYLDRLFGLGSAIAVSAMGVGATDTPALVSDTQLGTTPTILTFDLLPSRSGLSVTATRTFATGEANIVWAELALFNGTVNGSSVMFNRIAPIGPFTKTSALSLVVSVQITQG
jgi:hypothetical protein